MSRNTFLATLGALLFLNVAAASGYEIGTHAKIALAASATSKLSQTLEDLAVSATTTFDRSSITRSDVNNGSALGWIQEGAVREDGEDVCDTRVSNHFYNPITNAGLSLPVSNGFPSPDWGLAEPKSISSQQFSYRDARDSFWNALIANTDEERKHNLARTFRTLGQVVHLIQDAAQPQHTRDDKHAGTECSKTLGLFGPASAYEKYVDQLAALEKLNYAGYPVVQTVRPRDFWDTEFGEGIAEFTNRNFVSAGTNFRGSLSGIRPATDFPKPDGSGVALEFRDIQELLPGSALHGRMTFVGTPYDDTYLGSGGFNARTSTYSIFSADLTKAGYYEHFTLNRFNFEAAADLLIPRAVGYSAGMIDYFFRGKLELKAPDRFAYALTTFNSAQPTSGGFTNLDVNVRNATPGETAGLGKMRAIVRYRNSWPNPLIDMAWNQLEPTWSYAVSAEKEMQPTDQFQTVSFDFTDDPIPVNAGDVTLLVAFRGPLTKDDANYTEQDAIAIGGKDLYEPDLVDFGNITDYDCLTSQLYYTGGLDTSQRDLNHDGVPDIFGPWQLDRNHLRFYGTDQSFGSSSESASNYTIPSFTGGQYSRVVVLQDQDQYVATHTAETATEPATSYSTSGLTAAEFCGNINRLVEENGQMVHEVRYYGPSNFRGSIGARRVFYANQQVLNNSICFNAMPSQSISIRETAPGTFHQGALE